MAGHDLLLACVHDEEAAGAVSVLQLAGLETCLAHEGCVLVAEHSADEGALEAGDLDFAEELAAGADLRHHLARHIEELQQFVIPIEGVEIHQLSTAGVGDIGAMNTASGST